MDSRLKEFEVFDDLPNEKTERYILGIDFCISFAGYYVKEKDMWVTSVKYSDLAHHLILKIHPEEFSKWYYDNKG